MGYTTEVSKEDLDDQLQQIEKLDPKPIQNEMLGLLSSRELDIIRFIGKGFTDKEIAEKLRISIHVFKTHRKRIIGKLKLKKSASSEIFAMENAIQ